MILLSIALGLSCGAGPLRAEDLKGTFKEVSARLDTLTLTVAKQERTFPVSAAVKVLGLDRTPLKDGLESKLFRHPGVLVAVKTEHRDGRSVLVEIVILRRSASPVRPG